ncbi:restriction endonuclease subunit S [Oscillibacter sp.]|uniref:restriction endonuclease subunit S n=1 Tax=Oscillibacter sp. TaxID=1945593 RepID=UPI0028A08207|nr:restriction endonuclease subunit S [Oscillibacter sp.]
MADKSKKPAIRFAGFTDAWEQRKFSDITYPAGEKNRENLPLESYSITNESGFVPQNEQFENGGTMREADKRMYYIVSPNSFAYNPARINVGSIGYQNTAKNVIVSSLYEVFKTTEDIDDRLLWHWFKSPDFQKLIVQLQEGGVRLYFYYDKLCMGEVALPEIEEQRKIGQFHDTLDTLITLHQRKYDKLQNVKKSMLEKMFPKNGRNIPEIRFAGFTDAWEQRKLGEISDKVTEKNAGLQFIETFTNSAEFGVISQKDFFDHSISKIESLDGYYIVRSEDFVYNPRISVTAPVGPINRNKLGRNGVMSPLYTVFRPHEVDNTYLEHYFKSRYWHAYMNFNGDSGARSDRFSIKDDLFFQMPIPLPDIDEQIRIGKYLSSLDNLITLHQRELEKLKNLKKACLEKMFV